MWTESTLCAAYASYRLGGLTENYYFGIRRYPYCTDLNKNPLTFKDIDPNQASSHDGIPRNPVIGRSAMRCITWERFGVSRCGMRERT
jgi:hypothetical protein